MTTASPADDSSKLDAIIASYLEAIERGEFVDRELFLQQHPDFAEELRAFFVDFDRLQLTRMQPGRDPDMTFVPQNEPKPGSMIGDRYKLRENIGEGGMGSVRVAEQLQPVKRRVAIKLIKAGIDSKQVLARFEAERQALALMDHPNIAKVFDGGMTEHGRPYFVMEYVKGVPFTEYCDKACLSLKERLNLFIPVCQAVQHAHHKGIVHRDLKPSNILICLYDGKPVPKVIDFGLAKAMHQQLTEQSIYTVVSDFDGRLPELSRCLYSRWSGYLEQTEWQTTKMKLQEVSGDLIEAHTSGHIYHDDIIEFVGQINAKSVIPIHTFEPEKFAGVMSGVRLLADGETLNLS